MTIYSVTKLFREGGIFRPKTYSLGDVDIRPASTDLKQEREAIRISLVSNNERDNLINVMRITTVIEAEDEDSAINLANESFSAPIDLFRTSIPGLSRIDLLESGCILNLDTLTASEIKRKKSYGPFSAFMRELDLFPHMDHQQWLLKANTDLTNRYLRSIHWSGDASHEKNLQLRILFRWFAVEAMWKESETDNMATLILWALGFPNGKGAAVVRRELIQTLQEHPTYSAWHKKLEGDLEAIRIFRNKSSHEGFRPFDFPRHDLLRFEQIMVLGCARAQGLAMRAIESGIQTLSEAKDALPLLFEYRELIKEDVLGTVIFSLERRSDGTE